MLGLPIWHIMWWYGMAFLFASQILCHLHMPVMYTNQQKCNHCLRLLEAVHLYPMVYNRRHWLQILYLHLQHRYNWQNEVRTSCESNIKIHHIWFLLLLYQQNMIHLLHNCCYFGTTHNSMHHSYQKKIHLLAEHPRLLSEHILYHSFGIL